MITINLRARGKLRQQCLTFGDIIVASALDPELRVHGECMVNANESYRRHTSHVCHKHCRSNETSITGEDEIGHCQKCKKHNAVNMFSNQPQPTITTKIKKGLISNLGNTALTQICILMLCSMAMLGGSIALAVIVGAQYSEWKSDCKRNPGNHDCSIPSTTYFAEISGGFGGFNRSLPLASLPPDSLQNELISFSITNGAQFIYSLLYLMLIYNITLISQEHDWGKLETERRRLRCTIVKGDGFIQRYLLQLPKKILFPIMVYSVFTHWMIGEALQAQETIWRDHSDGWEVEHSNYTITYAAYPLWIATTLILFMTGACWWAFTYNREGYIPQMFGSIRTLCAATTSLDDFPLDGVQWGDLGMGEKFRHAGLTAEDILPIQPNELYAGKGPGETKAPSVRATGVEHTYLPMRNIADGGKRAFEKDET
ncbi:hypothetical protein K491DRAFT_585125 [Lophiostoma macrostomum CBS 122681]|uniref:Uncharacterized protein n=1 Tax=Lophiostoma macrostomum CBS 122681 TaxID=1314788 RepID=A0A6A6TQQ5_9PLEO|nr:hypothetical protein K491DRAFT_585125 [Lophiostoma macrostomum CBS 122681]